MNISLPDRVLPALVVVAFVVLGATYSVTTPIFEAPDELTHYPVVQHIAAGNGLPVQVAGQETAWRQEGSQPPLYYLAAAALTAWIDASDLPDLLWYNPHAYIGIPIADGNKNQVVHTQHESFPWHGAVLAIHLIRLFSVALGACTVYLAYRLAQTVFPRQRALAVGTMMLVAFNPMFLFIGSTVNNDNLATALSSLILLIMVRALALSSPAGARAEAIPGGRSFPALLGLLLGLAALTKLSTLGLFPLAGLTLLALAWQRRSLAWLLSASITVGGVAALVAGWWYARNWLLYGDPTALSTLLAVVGQRSAPVTWQTLLDEFEGLRISFWALFGAMNVLGNPMIYRVADAFSVLAVLGLAAAALQGRLPRVLVLPVLWVLILVVALVRYTQMTEAFQGRLLFPGIQSIALLLAVGLVSLLPWRWGARLLASAVAGLGLLAVASPFVYIMPAYPGPDLLLTLDASAVSHPVAITFDGRAELVGYSLDRETVRPGDDLTVTLYWRVLRPFDRDYSLFIHLFGPTGARVAKRDTFPARGAFPTRLWQPGQVFRDPYRITVSAVAQGPARLRLEAGLYDLSTLRNLPMVDGQGRPIESPVLGYVKLAASRPQAVAVPNLLGYRLGDRIVLAGYEVAPGTTSGALRLTLYWQALGRPAQDYAVFTHLLDDEEGLWGQRDGEPQGGQYPTSYWDEGETIVDAYEIVPKEGAPAGRYRLAVGMYDRASGRRLPVSDERGQPLGDRVLIEVRLP